MKAPKKHFKNLTKTRHVKRRSNAPARQRASTKAALARARKKRPSAKKNAAKAKTNAARNYSMATIKELFGLCSNQCAFPDCTNEIIAAGTKWSKAATIGHICHIYAAADKGPRGKPGLTEEERRSPGNLILMCGYHHPRVDKQWQTYPASKLKKWKKAHEAKATKGTAEAIKREADIQKHAFVEQMSDEQIERALERIRRARYLVGFPTEAETLALAAQVEQSRYSGGSDEVRARALAWCARILSQGKTAARARELLLKSKNIATTAEAALAEVFLMTASDKNKALAALSKIRTPASRSAALRIVTNRDKHKEATAWVAASGLSIGSFDAEGKFSFITNAFLAGDWTAAKDASDTIVEADLEAFPPLLYSVGMARLLTAIPEELRAVTLTQLPFEADTFPLASSPEHLSQRRIARTLFARVANFAAEVGAADAANLASDFALWLGLRDPDEHNAAMTELRESMSDPVKSLRRVNMAIRFGLKLDFAAIEERIDQSVALSGKGTGDEAFARFSLAFTKGSPKAVADYLEKHRAQLYEHLQKNSIVGLEIEVLARAGLVTTAKEKLDAAVRDGLSPRDKALLDRVIAEASGSDPIAERRALYESSGDLRALANLADGLERAGLWQDLLPYAEKLFGLTPSVETYEVVVRCLNDLGRYDELLKSLSENSALIDQSQNLRAVWAWTLYREGRFAEATAALQRLSNGNDQNARSLRVNIAVASGSWDKLLDFCNETWVDRNQYSAKELLHAAQLSIAVNGPHSRELVVAATEKEPGSPEILAAAYFQATSAGWEQNQAVGSWLNRAAQLSGDDGPLKSVSIKELVDQKPEWDKQTSNVWDQLKTGKLPTFAAGQLLNRSLLDFYLLPSLTNPAEVDVRKRNIIFAYSGARLPQAGTQPKTLALDLAAIVTFARLGLLDKVLTSYEIAVPHSTLGWLFQEREKATFHQPSRIKDAAATKQLIANGTLCVVRPASSPDHKLTREVGAELAAMLSTASDKSATGSKTLVVRSSPLHRLGTLMDEEADISGYEHCICSCTAVIDYLKLKGALTQPEEQRARDFMKLQEKPWATELHIDDETEVYLDDLSVSHLKTAGVLGKLKAASLKTYITQSEDSEANALLDAESLGKQQLDTIEQIRSKLTAAITSGRAHAVRTMKAADDEKLFRLHPTYGVLGLVTAADAIVVDDRFVNQHPTMTNEVRTAPLLCSLDVLDLLHMAGDLSVDELYAHRIVLRQAGYQLIALTDDELAYHLKNATVTNGQFNETAELRAIRESLLRARMSALVQLPGETQFLHRTLGAYIRAMKRVWETVADKAEAMVYADYLLSQVDVRAWAPSAIPGNERGFALFAYASYALQIISPPLMADKIRRAAYYEWITDRFLNPVKEYQPEVYAWIVARSRELAVSGADEATRQYEDDK